VTRATAIIAFIFHSTFASRFNMVFPLLASKESIPCFRMGFKWIQKSKWKPRISWRGRGLAVVYRMGSCAAWHALGVWWNGRGEAIRLFSLTNFFSTQEKSSNWHGIVISITFCNNSWLTRVNPGYFMGWHWWGPSLLYASDSPMGVNDTWIQNKKLL